MKEVVHDYKQWLLKFEPDDPWVRENKLDRFLSDLYRYEKALKRKAAIGVYGESQAGKSFLINALLSGNNPLSIDLGGTDVPFTKLNPDQGSEATAVICRYTQEADDFIEGYVNGELHTVGELIRILFGGLNELDLAPITSKVDNFSIDQEDIPQGGNTLKSSVVYDLLDHLNELKEQLGPHHDFYTPLEQIYTLIEQEYIGDLSLHKLKYLLSFLWEGFGSYQRVVDDLFNFYEKVNQHSSTFHLNSSLVRDVLNTNTLLHSYDNGDKFDFHLGSKLKIESGSRFPLSILQIACSELILSTTNKADILQKVDLLDFPGLRPFAEKGNLKKPGDIDDKMSKVMEIIKQGKLKVAFDQYSQRREIPALLLVSPSENHNAKSLPGLIKGWVYENYGENGIPNDEQVNSLLFTVMTKADKLFNQNSFSQKNINDRIESRFDVNFQTFFSDFLEDIDGYNNIYMTINTAIDTIDLLKNEKKQQAKELFLSHGLVSKYLGDRAEEIFEALYTKSKGIALLKKNILSVTERLPDIKKKYVEDSISEVFKDIENHAQKYLVEKDKEEQLKKEVETAESLYSIFKKDPSLFSIVSYYLDINFPKTLHFTNKKSDPLGLQDVFSDESDNGLEGIFTDLLDSFLENLTGGGGLEEYKYSDQYLSNFDISEFERFFSKSIKYLRSNKELYDDLTYVFNGIDINNKHQRRSFRNYIKYRCLSEINGYFLLRNNDMSGLKGVLQSLPNHIQEIYTCSLPEFDTKANEELEKILNEIEELQTA